MNKPNLMDLDNIKKTWQETEIKPAINDEKIEKMISNEGQSALGKLISYEKLGLWALFPGSVMLIPMWHIHYILVIMLGVMLIATLIWQLYKLRLLKKMDVMNMNILEILSHVNKYKMSINKEIIAVAIVLFIFFSFYIYYTTLPQDFSSETVKNLAIRFAAVTVAVVIACIYGYKRLYIKNIKKLEASVKEVQEFGEDNQ